MPNASRSGGLSAYCDQAHDSHRLANITFCDTGAAHAVGGSIGVYISAVNDPPEVSVTLPMTKVGLELQEASTLSADLGFWAAIPGGTIVVSDTDVIETMPSDAYDAAGDPPLTVTIEVAYGIVTLGTLENLAFVAGDGVNDRSIRFLASLRDTNNAFVGMQYLCSESNEKPCYAGTADNITVHVDDNGYSGRGGALTGFGSLPLRVLIPSSEDLLGEKALGGPRMASWTDTNKNYEGTAEPEASEVFGDSDYWDD